MQYSRFEMLQYARIRNPIDRIANLSGVFAAVRLSTSCVPHRSLREQHRTKEEAVEAAKERARGQEPSQVKVHTSDGNMEYESTYGEDPRRTPS